jgi:hypothetical protein
MLRTGAGSFTARNCEYTEGGGLDRGSGALDTGELGDGDVPPHLLKYITRRRHCEGYVVHGIDVSGTFSLSFFFGFKLNAHHNAPPRARLRQQERQFKKTMVEHKTCHTSDGVV